MKPKKSENPLEALLRLGSRLVETTLLLEEDRFDSRDALLARRRHDLAALGRRLLDRDTLPRPFAEAIELHRLRPRELMILVVLVVRRIQVDADYVSGRILLEPLCSDSWELARFSHLLEPRGRLLSSALVRVQSSGQALGLDANFRVAERFFQRILGSLAPARAPREDSEKRETPYLGDLHHLRDFKRLIDLHVERAALLFPSSYWSDLIPSPTLTPGDANEMILRLRSLIADREIATAAERTLPVVGFRVEQGLQDDEEIVVLTLLLHELLVSSSFVDLTDLVRLISASEADVLRKRRLFAADARLRDQGILQVDSDSDRDVAGEVNLAAWVGDQILVGLDDPSAIRADEQQRFHRYLADLDDSEDFFRQL